MINFIGVGLVAALVALPALAAYAEECSPSSTGGEVATEFLNEDGYPKQMKITQDVLVVSSTPPCVDSYVFLDDRGNPIFAKDARITYSGQWKKIAFRRVATSNTDSEELSYNNSKEVTEEIAHEASVGLSTSATVSVEPFGIGFEASVEASLGYALSIANGSSEGEEWGHTVSVGPGEEVVVWTRQMLVEAEWEPTAYDLSKFGQDGGPTTADSFLLAQDWVKNVYIPSQSHALQANSKFTAKRADLLADASASTMKADWPTSDEVQIVFATEALRQMNEFMSRYDEPFEHSYTLPFRETYTVRYRYTD